MTGGMNPGKRDTRADCIVWPQLCERDQQLSRKRHIGNDIVSIVFADEGPPISFQPASFVSHFLRRSPSRGFLKALVQRNC